MPLVPPVAGPGTVTQSGEMIAASLTLQSSSQCLEVAAAVTSEYSSVNATSQVVTQSYPVASSAIAGDAAAPAPGISSVITPSTTFAALPPGSHVDSAGNQASTNPAFNGAAFQLRPEMQLCSSSSLWDIHLSACICRQSFTCSSIE